MKQSRLVAQQRNSFGKGASRALRRSGVIPAILYGNRGEVVPIQIVARTFSSFIQSNGVNGLVNLEVEGYGSETTLIKDLNRDPVKRNIVHADFMRISLDEPIRTAVSINLIGTPNGVKTGGILSFMLRQLEISCLPTEIPDSIDIDIAHMEINTLMRVEDLTIAEDISILNEPKAQILMITPPKAAKESDESIDTEQETPEETVENESTES